MKKVLSLMLSVLMIHAFSFAALSDETQADKARRVLLAAEVKAGVANLGAGKSSRVRVLLRDETKYDGYLAEIAEDHFVVADAKTGATAPITYPEVKGIKGNNFSTGAKIGIGVAVAAAVAALVIILESRDDEDSRVPPGSPQCVTFPCP